MLAKTICCCFHFIHFEIESHMHLRLTSPLSIARVALNSYTYLNLLSDGFTGMNHHTQLVHKILNNLITVSSTHHLAKGFAFSAILHFFSFRSYVKLLKFYKFLRGEATCSGGPGYLLLIQT